MKKITLIIVSYQRQDLIEKNMKFLSNYLLNVIWVDGSERVYSFDLSNSRFQYFHLPGKLNYLERIAFGISKVKTKYFLLKDDADIYLPSSLSQIERWLDKNEGYCASGQVYNRTGFLDKKRITEWGQWSTPLHISTDNEIARVKKMLLECRTPNIIYSVIPTKNFKKYVSFLTDISKNNPTRATRNLEIIFCLIAISNLKYAKLDVPFWIRNNSGTGYSYSKDNSFDSVLNQNDMEFCAKILKAVVLKKRIGVKNMKYLRKIFDDYLDVQDYPPIKKSKNNLKSHFLILLKRTLIWFMPSTIHKIQFANHYNDTETKWISMYDKSHQRKRFFDDKSWNKKLLNELLLATGYLEF